MQFSFLLKLDISYSPTKSVVKLRAIAYRASRSRSGVEHRALATVFLAAHDNVGLLDWSLAERDGASYVASIVLLLVVARCEHAILTSICRVVLALEVGMPGEVYFKLLKFKLAIFLRFSAWNYLWHYRDSKVLAWHKFALKTVDRPAQVHILVVQPLESDFPLDVLICRVREPQLVNKVSTSLHCISRPVLKGLAALPP